MTKGPTKREFHAQVESLRNPTPMSLEQALAAPDPVNEIAIRISGKPHSSMSAPEKVFWSVAYFMGDMLNGGLHQALTNETGELVPLFAEFAKRYGTPELLGVVDQMVALFPSGRVPADHDERRDAVAGMDAEVLDRLNEALIGCERDVEQGLVALARNNAGFFDLGETSGQR